MPAWKPTPLVGEALAAAQKSKAKVVGFSVTDPRPTLRQLCSLGPLIGGLADSASPGSFDVGRIPHAQALTEPLFPNVTLLTDDRFSTMPMLPKLFRKFSPAPNSNHAERLRRSSENPWKEERISSGRATGGMLRILLSEWTTVVAALAPRRFRPRCKERSCQ